MKQNFSIIEASPFKQYGDYYISAGTNSQGHYLKILKFNASLEKNQFEEISTIEVTEQITSLGWSTFGCDTEQEYLGILLAGHSSGALSLWSITQLFNSQVDKPNHGLIKFKTGIHHSKVTNIKYNHEKINVAATSSTEVIIVQIRQETNGGYDLDVAFICENDEDNSEISSIAWNDAVNFILAIGSSSSMVYIWDIKKKMIRFKIRDQSMTEDKKNIKTNVAWSADGMHIIISYDDSDYNFLTQYNISQLTAPFAEYHGGHKKSIFKIEKCPNDPNIVLSLGRDNSITCWSIRTQKAFATIQKEEKIAQILWNPKFPDCFITINEQGQLEMNQINFSLNPSIYTEEEEELPKWMVKKSLSAFGWGGRFITYNEKQGSVVNIHTLNSGNALTHTMTEFTTQFNSDKSKYLDHKINYEESCDSQTLNFWIALKCINNKSYNELFRVFGYDKEKLIEEAKKNVGRKTDKGNQNNKARSLLKDNLKAKPINALDLFETKSELEPKNNKSNISSSKVKEVEKEEPNTVKIEITRNLNWNLHSEKFIKAGLLAGDLELAMENAFKADRDAEALLIASNDPELFQKAKQEYLKKSTDMFIKNVFSSIINKNFNHLLSGNMKDWKEYLLYGLTYLSRDDFMAFSKSLGEKLFSLGDFQSSLVCFLLGNEPHLVIEKLYENYKNQVEHVFTNEEKEQLLHTLFEQITVINFVFHENSFSEVTNNVIVQYCELLVSHKLYSDACNLLVKVKNPEVNTLLLFDRIYGNNEDKFTGQFKRPQVPFKEIFVKAHVPPQKKINKPIQNNPQEILSGNSKQNQTISNKPILNQQSSSQSQNKLVKPPINTMINKPIIQQQQVNQKLPTPVSQFVNEQANYNQEIVEEKEIKKTFPIGNSTIKPPPIRPPIKQAQQQSTTQFNPQQQVNQIQQNQPFNQKQTNQSQPITQQEPQQNQVELDDEESRIIQSFERFKLSYNNAISDETKQKDMDHKISTLFQKLKTHEIKPLLKKLLNQFIDSVDSGMSTKDLQMLVRKIQANQWDQNKTWMPCLDKIVTMPKK